MLIIIIYRVFGILSFVYVLFYLVFEIILGVKRYYFILYMGYLRFRDIK